jgi:YHS domain-containing protein
MATPGGPETMSGLENLDRRVRERLASAAEEKRLIQEHLRVRMAELDELHQSYNACADRLMREIVRPRVERVISHFENVELVEPEPSGSPFHCTCRLRHCDRFPATGELRLILSHDERIENLLVIYRLEILPIFFSFAGHDQVAFPLADTDEALVAAWVEDRLIGFVETYLRVGKADQYQAENLVVDPVCGMRINRLYAAPPVEVHGRKFYFCTELCRRQFIQDPERYAAGAG